MTGVAITGEKLAQLKKLLRAKLSTAKSSHISEAIAALVGFKTHIALITALRDNEDCLKTALVSPDQFALRLHKIDPTLSIKAIAALDFAELFSVLEKSHSDGN